MIKLNSKASTISHTLYYILVVYMIVVPAISIKIRISANEQDNRILT